LAIEWDRTGQPLFERIVEALAYRQWEHADDVMVVDGRGVGGSQDILVVQGQRTRVFQLKYFVDGFPTSAKGRRTQIRRSFAAAPVREPCEWTLVVPYVLTPGEREFVDGLANGRDIKVSVIDRTRLDGLSAAFPDLEASSTPDQLEDRARIFNQEKAMLPNGGADHPIQGVVTTPMSRARTSWTASRIPAPQRRRQRHSGGWDVSRTSSPARWTDAE
jgi:hypothetical protein